MRNNNSIISVMFEEIKGLLTSIDKKLNERVSVKENLPSQGNVTEPKSNVQTDTVKPEQLLQLIAAYLQNSEQKIGKVSDAVIQSEKHVLSKMEDLKQITISQKPDSKVRHYHNIDLRSSKVVITIVCLSVFLLASLFVNVQQVIVNSRMTDNDLKYRYIKSTNGINSENLNKLEDVFHFNPDEKLIREIRQNVETWEKTIQNTAEKIEHEKLRNSKSKK
jgi:hypothetical protein